MARSTLKRLKSLWKVKYNDRNFPLNHNRIYQKFMDALDKEANPAKMAHVEFKMNRIDALFSAIYRKHPGQLFGYLAKNNGIQVIVRKYLTHIPESLRTGIFRLVR
ncbi:MAG TPA: hypothetical protein VJ417_04325, partial [Candidatus Glassbacteria bacterium]|nr:hypothetical protein [Candidatus Glassbacteria bacterium]